MPYQKTKEGRLVNEITLGDGYPLSNDLQPLKIGGEASVVEISHPLPDGSDNGLFKVNGDLDITGTLKTKLSHDLIYDFDAEVNILAQAKIDALVDSAPAALDTLNELAAALNDDASFSTTITNSLALKAPLAAPAFTGDATFDSTTLAIDSSNNRVGIGTTSPDTPLHVIGETSIQPVNYASNQDAFLIKGGAANNDAWDGHVGIKMKSNSSGQPFLTLRGTNNDTLNVISSKVGIGTTSPSTLLELQDDANTFARINTSGSGLNSGVQFYDNDVYKWQVYNKASDDSLRFKGSSDFVTIDSSGNVGIGTTSPSAELHISTSSPYPSLLLESTGASANIMRFTTTDGTFTVGQDYDDNFSIANAANITSDRVFTILKSNGNVGIGLTAPTTTLDVEGTVSYKHTAFSTAGPTDNIDVSDTTVLEVDTSSNNVIIGGFTGGVQGQILYIVKTNTANFIQLEHNEGGGSQDIFITTGSDERVVGYGGYTLYCNGTSWFSLSNPTGGADAG